MIVVASAGLNLPRALVAHCKIEETPHQIVVDGELHDTRSITSFSTVTEWVRTARSQPYPLGSSAPEYVTLFHELVKRTDQVLVVTGTRKILGTYDAAVAASRLVTSMRKGFDAHVLDTGLVELGAGLIALYCAAVARAGYDMASVIEAGQALAAASYQICIPHTIDFLTRMGRSDLTRRILPGDAQGSPVIGMKDGELRFLDTVVPSAQAKATFVELLLKRYKAGAALWVTIAFADDAAPAHALLAALRQRFDIRYAIVSHLGPAGYLFLGHKALVVSAHPVDAMNVMVRLPEVR